MQQSSGSMSHRKHRLTGGWNGVNRSRRNPAVTQEIARLANRQEQAKNQHRQTFYGSVLDLMNGRD